MKIYLFVILFCCFVSSIAYSQTTQQKAQELVSSYMHSKLNLPANQNVKINPIEVLRSSYADTKSYKNYLHKIDSLKLEARKIDARFAKLKTTTEINQSKKDSKNLSNQLVAVSDEMINFMTAYKGSQVGWKVKTSYQNQPQKKNRFFLNLDLTKVDSVR
jgi:hypothetical protein